MRILLSAIDLLLQFENKVNDIEPFDHKDYDAFENLLVTVYEEIFPNKELNSWALPSV